MTQPALPAPPLSAPEHPSPAKPARLRQKRQPRSFWTIALVLLALLVVFLLFWFIFRSGSDAGLAQKETTLSVVKADREDLIQDLQLTAEFHPFLQIELHAKVAGYLKWINVDVGDHVKSGQKIAELEIPEIEDDLARAHSAYQASLQEVKKAEADSTQAGVTYQRLLGVAKDHPKLVAQQELDDAKAKLDAMNGSLGSARQQVEERQSEVNRTTTLRDYASITVPFDGIITRRFADPGALIQAGTASNTQAMPLVELAQQDKLRLVFPVPESAAPKVRLGEPVEVTVSAIDETFRGAIARFSGKVDRDTRTMHTEVDVPNPDNHYSPGMYAFVRLILNEKKNALSIPVQALLSGDKPTVFTVNKQGIVEEHAVTLGLQTPEKAEILTGLSVGDQVIVGNRKGVTAGQKAQPKLVAAPSGK